MVATKEQERKALEKIKKIVDEMGENSYIGMAFEGCFELAEENIENDFALSMKHRAEKAEKDRDYFHDVADNYSKELEKLQSENDTLKKKILSPEDLSAIAMQLDRDQTDRQKEIDEIAKQIVTYADHPESPEFRKAVHHHRKDLEDLEAFNKLIETLHRIMHV